MKMIIFFFSGKFSKRLEEVAFLVYYHRYQSEPVPERDLVNCFNDGFEAFKLILQNRKATGIILR